MIYVASLFPKGAKRKGEQVEEQHSDLSIQKEQHIAKEKLH